MRLVRREGVDAIRVMIRRGEKVEKKLSYYWVMVLSLMVFLLGCGNKSEKTGEMGEDDAEKRIVLISKNSLDEHWLSLKTGAEKKIAEIGGYHLVLRIPQRIAGEPVGDTDKGEQISLVEEAIRESVAGIILAPIDFVGLAPVVDQAVEAGIPIVIVDSAVDTESSLTFIATDNYRAGQEIADGLAKFVDEKGELAIIMAQPGSGATIRRLAGFKERISERYPDISLIETRYSNGNRRLATSQASEIIAENPNLVGFYGGNVGSTLGILRAVELAGKKEKIKIVGFDSDPEILKGIESGYIQETVAQDPELMGRKAVEAIEHYLRTGTKGESSIYTDITIITEENLSQFK